MAANTPAYRHTRKYLQANKAVLAAPLFVLALKWIEMVGSCFISERPLNLLQRDNLYRLTQLGVVVDR